MGWISTNRSLTPAQQEINATMVRTFFKDLGWSDNAIAGMLANMQAESTINPGRWQNGAVGIGPAFGIVQWDPWTKIVNWVAETYGPGVSPGDGYAQCNRIKWEYENGQQWITVDRFPVYDGDGNFLYYEIPGLTWQEWIHSDADPYYLAQVFTTCYERPQELWQPWRWEQAARWFEYITGTAWHGKTYWLYVWAASRRRPPTTQRRMRLK